MMKFPRPVQGALLCLGLAFGALAMVWLVSGAAMSWLDAALVRGERHAAADYGIELEARGYANPGGIIAQTDGATALTLKRFLGRPVYVAYSAKGAAMFDAETGEKLPPITEAAARAVAMRDFVGDGEIDAARLLAAPPREYGRAGPVWRVTFTDDLETRLYISPETGAVEARANKYARLYGFFRMLHVMDDQGRADADNSLIRAVSLTALLFALGALAVIAIRFASGRLARKRR